LIYVHNIIVVQHW